MSAQEKVTERLYTVSVSRMYAHNGETQVEASSPEQAIARAREDIGNVSLSIGEADETRDLLEIVREEDWPGQDPNADGVTCPKCGGSEEIDVVVRAAARLNLEGWDVSESAWRGPVGVPAWDRDSAARCMGCGWKGPAGDLAGFQ